MVKNINKTTIGIAAILLIIIAIVTAWIAPFFYLNAGAKFMLYIYPETNITMLGDTIDSYSNDRFAKRTIKLLSWMNVEVPKCNGAYMIEEDFTPLQVAQKIRNKEQTPVKLIFHNLRTKEQFAQNVSKQLMFGDKEMLSILEDSVVCASYGKTTETITNILFPDTYEVYWNSTPKGLLNKLNGYYTQFWTAERTSKANKLGLSPDEVQILASIVEEETAKVDEYGKVARLYLNRLERNMPLQADPTVKYAIGDFSIRRITHAMLKTVSPYNTYQNIGLPPGPIRIVTKRTVDAVLNAPQHDYLYMCAREDFSGYHNFTASYTRHLANARRYQRELNRRGIK